MKTLKFFKFTLITLALFQLVGTIFLISNIKIAAAAEDLPKSLLFTPQINIPNSDIEGTVKVGTYNSKTEKMSSDLLGKYIQALYNYGLAIAGILAAIVLMGGGVLWLTSSGEASKITQAKDLIIGSITGMVILFCSWIILNTVNPDLLKLKTLETTVVKRMDYCCDPQKGNVISEKNGKCSSGTICQNNQECLNDGNNNFACIEASKFLCCEYKPKSGTSLVKCSSVQSGCPKAPAEWNYITYHTGYCGNKTILANSCLAGDCSDKDDGEICEGMKFGYCYNEICWLDAGQEGEPCGNQPGSTCLKDGSKCDNHDYNGGRDCGEDLFCCQKVTEK
jgi:hypothetical protein